MMTVVTDTHMIEMVANVNRLYFMVDSFNSSLITALPKSVAFGITCLTYHLTI